MQTILQSLLNYLDFHHRLQPSSSPSLPPHLLSYEKVFGEGYVSSGGPDTTREFVKSLNLHPGDRVLDLGCGIGGGDFYMVGCTSPLPSITGTEEAF